MNIKEKIYYHSTESLLFKRVNKIVKPGFKSLFLYFDYEREFSGFSTKISNDNVLELVQSLYEFRYRSTWFTVGRVLDLYFSTVEDILLYGNEIGSHTFNHVVPYHLNFDSLSIDFKLFNNLINDLNIRVDGFHSPMDRWNLDLFKIMKEYAFIYDIFPPKKSKFYNFDFYNCYYYNNMYRLITLGDDWPLYNGNYSRSDVFNYFKGLYDKIKINQIRGIGAHPWVLFSDSNILMGYFDFLEYISHDSQLNINTASEFVNGLTEKSGKI